MKVIDNSLRDFTFNELGISSTFKYGDGYFIKIETIQNEFHTYNAIKLNSGTAYTFHEDDIVVPFNCELIVL